MKIGYARVSTINQKLDRQLVELSEVGCVKVFKDKSSGKDNNREQFQEMLEFAREDDVVVVSSLDRLGRNYNDVKDVLDYLNKKSVAVEILDAPFLNFNTGNETLDRALFDMLTSMLSYISDNERKKMLERQSAGIAIAKAKGAYKGKQVEYSANSKDKGKRAIYHNIVRGLQDNLTISKIARDNDVTRRVVYRIKSELEEQI